LIIETAESSLEYDRTIKKGLYAENGIAEYWVVDVHQECLYAYSDLRDELYRLVRRFHRGDLLAPQFLPDCRLLPVTLEVTHCASQNFPL
jgi:Uma2 family endonuclease